MLEDDFSYRHNNFQYKFEGLLYAAPNSGQGSAMS